VLQEKIMVELELEEVEEQQMEHQVQVQQLQQLQTLVVVGEDLTMEILVQVVQEL